MKIELNKPYLTRDGIKVKVVSTKLFDTHYPILGLIEYKEGEQPRTYTPEGKHNIDSEKSNEDLVEEYSPWHDVEVDTKILVKDAEHHDWIKTHFAKYENGKVHTWNKGYTSWTNESELFCTWNYAKLGEEDDG